MFVHRAARDGQRVDDWFSSLGAASMMAHTIQLGSLPRIIPNKPNTERPHANTDNLHSRTPHQEFIERS